MLNEITLSVNLQKVIMLSHYVECHHTECHWAKSYHAESHCVECDYAECHYTDCHYAECRGASEMDLPLGLEQLLEFQTLCANFDPSPEGNVINFFCRQNKLDRFSMKS
jgi:hypothetical protein